MSNSWEIKCRLNVTINRGAFNVDFVDNPNKDKNPLVRWYLEQYNSRCDKDGLWVNHEEKISEFDFRLVFHDFKDLFGTIRYNFQQDYYKYDSKVKLPTIHLTWFDVFKDIEDKKKGDDDSCEKEMWLSSGIQRYHKIVDSGIWNYYVPVFCDLVNDSDSPQIVIKRFHDSLVDICSNYSLNRYRLIVAKENVDLGFRMLEQSYLKGSHKAVSPFLFHSEYEMKRRIQESFLNSHDGEKVKVIDVVKRYKWRFLLIDDKSIKPMSVSQTAVGEKESGNTNFVQTNKLQIIADNLHRIIGFDEDKIWYRCCFEEKSDKSLLVAARCGRVIDLPSEEEKKTPGKDQEMQIVIDCVETIEDAEKCLKYYNYEVILLDYLLKKKNNHEQEYGYHLLKKILSWHEDSKKTDKDRYIIGPNNSLTIMFMSAYTTAVQERILEMGINRSEKGLWYIGNCACPTNTPYLFSHLLLQLMRHRIRDLSYETEDGVFSIVELLELIYSNPNKADIQVVRKCANKYFNSLLFMREKYKRIKKDLNLDDENDLKIEPRNEEKKMKMQSSLLVYSAFKVVHHFSNDFFDHLQHLVYLTAFGTVRQSVEMMREYSSINKTLCDYDRIMDGGQSTKGRNVSEAIHEYIIQLENH